MLQKCCQHAFGVPNARQSELAKSAAVIIPKLVKRTVILTDKMIETISAQAKQNDREFSAEARKLIGEGLERRGVK